MTINLDNIRERNVLNILANYAGTNPYIFNLKKEFKKKGKIKLTSNQTSYIKQNHDKEPVEIKKVIRISEYLGLSLQEKYNLSFTPEKILFEYILGETEKTYHIYGKLKKNQESEFYWIPKTQILDDPFFEEIDVEFDHNKYINTDTLSRTPFTHQIQGIKFLLSRTHCILADDMGLG